ncbi:hypothetical protein AK812_SmicGene31153 [Symbiodinium microadriaticum]|uniref:Uncharacterized protein n=1 Tax=Symbiodinium microadriaticum TaxID=2951 RepID=A0A1Q9CXE6_SYMMI|nr:hypothetical protein AK812_SmicGene31153 [Symbiodinium microadriaticum]
MRAASPASMTPRTREGRPVARRSANFFMQVQVSREVQRGFCLGLGIKAPPVFVKTRTGAIVTQVTQESFLAAGIVGSELAALRNPAEGLCFGVDRPISELRQSEVTSNAPDRKGDWPGSLAHCLFICFQDAPVLSSKALGLALLAYAAVPHYAAKAAEEQLDEQAAPAKAVAEAHAKAMQEQREQYEGMLEEQREQYEGMLEALQAGAVACGQEQQEQYEYEDMLEVERRRAELEHARRQQVEEKLATAVELNEEALATMMTMSEAHEQKLQEMQALRVEQLSLERKDRLQAEAEVRQLQAELEKFSVVSISDSELAAEAEAETAAAAASSSTPPDAQPHTAEASSSTRQIVEMPSATAQTQVAGQMPRRDYRDITCWQGAGVYGKSAAELLAGRRAAEEHAAAAMSMELLAILLYPCRQDGTSKQDQAERVQEVRNLYRSKHGPHSTPNAVAWLPMDATCRNHLDGVGWCALRIRLGATGRMVVFEPSECNVCAARWILQPVSPDEGGSAQNFLTKTTGVLKRDQPAEGRLCQVRHVSAMVTAWTYTVAENESRKLCGPPAHVQFSETAAYCKRRPTPASSVDRPAVTVTPQGQAALVSLFAGWGRGMWARARRRPEQYEGMLEVERRRAELEWEVVESRSGDGAFSPAKVLAATRLARSAFVWCVDSDLSQQIQYVGAITRRSTDTASVSVGLRCPSSLWRHEQYESMLEGRPVARRSANYFMQVQVSREVQRRFCLGLGIAIGLLSQSAGGISSSELEVTEPEPAGPTEQDAPALRQSDVLVLQERQGEQAAPAKEQVLMNALRDVEVVELGSKAGAVAHDGGEQGQPVSIFWQEQREQYESMLEVQRGFCLGLGIKAPPVFVKTRTGAVVTQVRAVDLHARATLRQGFVETRSELAALRNPAEGLCFGVDRPSSELRQSEVTANAPDRKGDWPGSLAHCLFICFQDAPVLASKDAPAPRQSYVLVPQALGLALLAYAAVPHNAAKAAEEQQDEQAAPAKEQQETFARMLQALQAGAVACGRERGQRVRRLGQWHVGGSVGSVSEGLRCLSSLWQEQRQHFEGLLEVERRCTELEHDRRQQVEEKLALALELKEEAEGRGDKEQKDFREAALEAAARDHAQILQEQRQHFEGLLEAERRCTELEHGRRHQEKLATALEAKAEVLEANDKTLEEVQALHLDQLSLERKQRLQAEAEVRQLQAELEKFSIVSISDSELAAEAEAETAAAAASSSTPPDAQPHTAEASSSTRQIVEMPSATAQTQVAGQMPRRDYRDITSWQGAGVYGKSAAELLAGRRAAEEHAAAAMSMELLAILQYPCQQDGTSKQEQAERVQEVRNLYRSKHGPHSTPNAVAWLPMDAT